MDFDKLGKEFVDHYYNTFDNHRENLFHLYQEDSMLTFESQRFQGARNIAEKLLSLNFKRVQHAITVLDCQPTSDLGVIVFVVGQLKVDEEPQPLQFSQVFHLRRNPAGNYYCQNDMFRLNLH
eukprot:Sdes_comp20903_c0_seq5m18097